MVTADKDGITVNFFEDGKFVVQYAETTVEIIQKTAYPADGKLMITVKTDAPKVFALRVRIPGWTQKSEGYAVYEKQWHNDTVELDFPMPLRTQLPQAWDKETIYVPSEKVVCHDPDDDHYIAIMRGPITLAADSRTGKDAGSVFDFVPIGKLCADKTIAGTDPCLLKMEFLDSSGEIFYLVDYASAGKDWQNDIAAWLRTK
jgi:DUF1680 family protein